MNALCRTAAGLAAVLPLCAACGLYSLVPTFTKATDYPRHEHQKQDIVLLMENTVPTDPAYEVGQVDVTRSNFQSNEEMFDAMRDLAVKNGFDGIDGIYCGPDYNAAYRCTGNAFVYK